jgi:hypothetical protein
MTTTTFRPDSTVSAGATTLTGAASRHAALSDDSDASWMSMGATDTSARFTFDATAIPAGSRLKQWQPRVRVEGEGSTPRSLLWTYDIAGFFSYPLLLTVGNAPPPVTIAGSAFTNGYTPFFEVLLSGKNFRVYEAYVDLTYVEQPVVTVDDVDPDPVGATSKSITWVNTLDSDGGGQTRYQVRLFTAAQYGIGGFDPATSPATFDTGDTASGSTSAVVAGMLTGTYRAYVRVAQTVNGASHWSDWDFDQFDVDVETSDVLTVAAAGSNSTASVTITVERDTSSEAWDLVEVQRSVDNGATWSPVRSATYVDSTGDADTFQVVDYEVGNDVQALYRARATRILSDDPITGSWVQSAPSASWSSTVCWLKCPDDPALNMPIRLKSMIQLDRPRRQGVFNVLGRNTPVVVSDVLSASEGTLDILVDLDSDSPEELLEQAVLLFHPPEGWRYKSFYLAPGSVRAVRGSRIHEPQVRWLVPFVEVDTPGDPAASSP